jgi:hypothetical protein
MLSVCLRYKASHLKHWPLIFGHSEVGSIGGFPRSVLVCRRNINLMNGRLHHAPVPSAVSFGRATRCTYRSRGKN